MVDGQDWLAAYTELCEVINNPTDAEKGMPEVKHIDLWHEQIDYEADEYPFPDDSIFLEFNTSGIATTGLKVQDLDMIITFFYVFDTLSDSYHKSDNKEMALSFGTGLMRLHKLMQGRAGLNFSSLDRIALRRVPAPQYLMVYAQSYRCIIRDQSAMDEYTDGTITGSTISNVTAPPQPDYKLFDINL